MGPRGEELFMMVGPPSDKIAALVAGTERLHKVYRAKVEVPAAR